MPEKVFESVLRELGKSKNKTSQIALLRDLYTVGQLNAYVNPTTASNCLRQISTIKLLGYGSEWVKQYDESYFKSINGFSAVIRYKSKGHKILKGLVLTTNITGALKRVPLQDNNIDAAKRQAEDILFRLSGNDCSKLKHI